jgi:hypothetical protein
MFPLAICCVNFCSSCLLWQCTVALKRIVPVPTSHLMYIPLCCLQWQCTVAFKRPFHFLVSHISCLLFLLVLTKLYLCPPTPHPKIWLATFLVTYLHNQTTSSSYSMTLKKEVAHLSGTQVSTYKPVCLKAEDHNPNIFQGKQEHSAEKNICIWKRGSYRRLEKTV